MKIRAKYLRISKRKEISFLFENGKRWNSPKLKIIYVKNCLDYDRVGVIVSKANGNAVSRNRKKRILRNIFFKNKNIDPPFFDILLRPVGEKMPPAEEIQSCYLSWKKVAKQY